MASSSRVDSLKKQYEENPRRYFAALANEYRKSGDLEQAIGLCRTHLPQQPSHISGHIVFGQALFEAGELVEARTVFETALGLDPENLIALRHLGDIANANGNPAEARDWYTRIMLADPRNDEIQALLDALPADAVSFAPPEAETPPAAADDVAADDVAADDVVAEEQGADAADVLVSDTAAADAQAVNEWAGKLDARATVDQGHAPEPPAEPEPIAAAEEPVLIDVEAPPAEPYTPDVAAAPAGTALDEPFDFVAGGPGALRDGLAAPPPPPVEHPEVPEPPPSSYGLDPAPAADALAFERAEPVQPPPHRAATPPIGMEAIFEAEAAGLRDVISPDVIPTAHQPSRDEAADEAAAGAGSDREPDVMGEPLAPPPAEAVSYEQTHAAYGETADLTGDAAPPVHDLGSEYAQFAAPERGPTDDSLLADAGAAPSAFVTETMAGLYLQQGFHDEALGVYRQLLARNPEDESLRARVHELEARVRVGAPARRTARDFFGALALRRAPTREPMGEPASRMDDGASESNGRAEAASVASLGDALLYAPPEMPADGPSAPDGPLAQDLAGPAHTSEPLAFEGATASGILSHHPSAVSEADLAAGAPVTASFGPGEDAGAFHPPLDDSVDAGASSGFTGSFDDAFGARSEPAPELGASEVAGSLDRLFGGRAVARGDEDAAASLANAFTGEQDVVAQGKPTRPADAELSLDHVFRQQTRATTPTSTHAPPAGPAPTGAAAGAPRPGGAFSFDQFFAEGGAPPPETTERSAQPGDVAGSDIEQFNAWLEGLKKK